MKFSAFYNLVLTIWGYYLYRSAGGVGESDKISKNADRLGPDPDEFMFYNDSSYDMTKMIANTNALDFDATADGYYCQVTTYRSKLKLFGLMDVPEWKCNTYDGNT
jgi:hypothetical protein